MDELDNLLQRIYALEHNYKGIRTELRLLMRDVELLKEPKDQPPKGL